MGAFGLDIEAPAPHRYYRYKQLSPLVTSSAELTRCYFVVRTETDGLPPTDSEVFATPLGAGISARVRAKPPGVGSMLPDGFKVDIFKNRAEAANRLAERCKVAKDIDKK